MALMRNATIGQKITVAFGAILAVSALTTGVGLWHLKEVETSTKTLLEVPLAKERMVGDWYRIVYGGSRRTLAIAKSSDNSLVQFFAEDASNSTKEVSAILKKVETLLTSDEEKRLVASITETRGIYNKHKDAVTKAKADGNAEEAERILRDGFAPAAVKYQELLRELLAVQRKTIDESAAGIDAAAGASIKLQMLLTVLLILLVGACGFLLKTAIVRPLAEAVTVARRVAKGDLTADVHVNSRDEAGQMLEALRDMNSSLRTLVTEVAQSAGAIATASGEITRGNSDLSSRTEQQASSLEETAASMEELTSTVRASAENAQQANQLAASASEIASRGGEVVSEVVQTMTSISESSRKITDIIAVIDGIAFQTNILALNAAVEAARAGEQGRGFAVVASEVRALAQRSASAAKEIKTLIDASAQNVETGGRLVGTAGDTMREIVQSITRVTDVMAEISAATREQSSGIEQINRAVGEMDQATQQNAALVEQAGTASSAMRDHADRLHQLVSTFKVGSMPVTAASVAAPAAVVPARPSSAARTPVSAARTAPAVPSAAGSRAVTVPAARKKPAPAAPYNGDWEEF